MTIITPERLRLLRRSLDRLSRQGKAFSVAIARIDHFEKLSQGLTKEQLEECLQWLAAIIKKCLRSFDDAYRLENGEFILSLIEKKFPKWEDLKTSFTC